MMRPSISPINAGIYGVEEPTLAPVEDLALSVEDFEALCREGALKPHAHNVILKPHVRLWPSSEAVSRASGHAELEGFLPNSVLRGAVRGVKPKGRLCGDGPKEQGGAWDKRGVVFRRQPFPAVIFTAPPATLLR